MKNFGKILVAASLTLSSVMPASSSAQSCVGNCLLNTPPDVTVDEIITMVNLALMGGVTGCTAGDGDGNGSITVDEIITAVNNALNGCMDEGACGDGQTQAGEDCDDGGFCVGGEDSGTACSGEDDCAGEVGACIGGSNNLRGCTVGDGEGCPEGTCVKCRPVGGDGCAQNCTNETRITYPYKPGTNDGLIIDDGTGATVYGPIISVPLPISGGSQVLTIGRSRNGGPIPVVVKADDVDLPRIAVQTIACACVRGASAMTCGGTVFDENGVLNPNCTPGFEMEMTCPAERPCAPVHGPGNTASGFIDCSAEALEYSIELTQDCNGNQGELPFDPVSVVTSAVGGAGSAYLINSAAIGTVVGGCTGTAPDYGPDQQFCTDDDLATTFGTPNPIPLTTGSATGRVDNPADQAGEVNGPWTTTGARFTCDGDAITTASGTNLAGVFTSCDQPTINDIVVPVNFEAP